MFKHKFFVIGLLVLSIALLTQVSFHSVVQASPAGQVPEPNQEENHPISQLVPQPGETPQEVSALNVIQGVTYQTISSLLFRPIQGSTNWAYSYFYATLHLASPTTSGDFVYPLVLPHGADIRELTYYFRDNQPNNDLSMGLCQVQLGASAGLCAQWLVDSTGVNSSSIEQRTLTGDPILTIDNNNYSYFLVAVLLNQNAEFGVVSARIGYSYNTFAPTIMR